MYVLIAYQTTSYNSISNAKLVVKIIIHVIYIFKYARFLKAKKLDLFKIYIIMNINKLKKKKIKWRW